MSKSFITPPPRTWDRGLPPGSDAGGAAAEAAPEPVPRAGPSGGLSGQEPRPAARPPVGDYDAPVVRNRMGGGTDGEYGRRGSFRSSASLLGESHRSLSGRMVSFALIIVFTLHPFSPPQRVPPLKHTPPPVRPIFPSPQLTPPLIPTLLVTRLPRPTRRGAGGSIRRAMPPPPSTRRIPRTSRPRLPARSMARSMVLVRGRSDLNTARPPNKIKLNKPTADIFCHSKTPAIFQ